MTSLFYSMRPHMHTDRSSVDRIINAVHHADHATLDMSTWLKLPFKYGMSIVLLSQGLDRTAPVPAQPSRPWPHWGARPS